MQGSALFWWTGLVVGVLVVVSCGVQAQEAESRLWFEGEPDEDLEAQINGTPANFQVGLTYEIEGAVCLPGFFMRIPIVPAADEGLEVSLNPGQALVFFDQSRTVEGYEHRETVNVNISTAGDASPEDRLGFEVRANAPEASPPGCQPPVPGTEALIEGNVTVGAGDRKVKADGQGGDEVPEILIDEQERSVVSAPTVLAVGVMTVTLLLKRSFSL